MWAGAESPSEGIQDSWFLHQQITAQCKLRHILPALQPPVKTLLVPFIFPSKQKSLRLSSTLHRSFMLHVFNKHTFAAQRSISPVRQVINWTEKRSLNNHWKAWIVETKRNYPPTPPKREKEISSELPLARMACFLLKTHTHTHTHTPREERAFGGNKKSHHGKHLQSKNSITLILSAGLPKMMHIILPSK